VRQQYELLVYGYVVMPEHVHLLVSEPGAAYSGSGHAIAEKAHCSPIKLGSE